MIKNIFLDRDGVVNEVVFRDGGAFSPLRLEEFRLRKEFIDFYSTISERELNLFIVSNQPDIARKRMSEADLQAMTSVMGQFFRFKEILYCRHDDADNCDCRKPRPGMINALISKYSISREDCLIVGDSWKDVAAGRNAGIKTVFLEGDYNKGTARDFDFRITKIQEINSKQILGG